MNAQHSAFDAVAALDVYYGALDSPSRALIIGLAWLALSCLALNLFLRAGRLRRTGAAEDPFQAVITQPVKRTSRWRTAAVKKELMRRAEAKRISRPPRPKPAKAPFRPPKIPPIKPGIPQASAEVGRPHMEALCAVAELDFIKSAAPQDILSLKDRFGFIYVPSDSYPDAVSALKAKKHDFLDVFMPACAEDAGAAYSGIALAKQTRAVVLSESENVKRICAGQGIPCMSLSGWRAMEPQKC
jgi:hypothetical protein